VNQYKIVIYVLICSCIKQSYLVLLFEAIWV